MQDRVEYQITHPLMTENYRFDSWTELCEYALSLAENEATERLEAEFKNLAGQIADEIIESVREIE